MSRRPGGLTALAALNFLFGGIGLVINLVKLVMMEQILDEAGERAPAAGAAYAVALLGLASATLLLVAGFGYLKLKKRLGQQVGAAYAAVAILGAAAELVLTGEEFNILTLFFLVYPMVTLFLIYTTFRDDFVR
jgi:hypothetical protein